jgi:hypothetical protein
VQVEIVATSYVQVAAPDRLRASVLGLTDTAMVAAALLGALVAPPLAATLGPKPVVLAAAAGSVAAVVLVRRPVVVPTEADGATVTVTPSTLVTQ